MDSARAIDEDEIEAALAKRAGFKDVLFGGELNLDAREFAGLSFENCRFEVPVVREADFSEARFKDCTFHPARYANCKFNDVSMTNCTFFSAEEKGGCTFAFCEMRQVALDRCNFSSCNFDRCDLYNVAAADSSFRSCKFGKSSFQRALSRKVVICAAKFERCNLSFADLSALYLKGCEFKESKFSETLFFETDLTEAVFTNAIFDRAEFERAKLSKADLRGATISGLNLALVADYVGMTISASQQDALLSELGIKVWPV